MKKKHLLIIVIAILPAYVSCQKDNNEKEGKGATDITLSTKSAQVVEADNQFGTELFTQLAAKQNADSNLMISPLSISLALAMAWNGASGETKTQMEEVLHKNGFTTEEINQSYFSLVSALYSHDPKVNLSIANAIFYRQDYPVKNNFLLANQIYYNAEVEGLDFMKTTSSLNTINDWVKEKTKNKIKTILDQISARDIMYLINAVYFNGKWTWQFEKNETKNKNFTLANGTSVQVPTMTIKKSFSYTEEENVEILELPYGYQKYSMLLILPKEGYSISDIAPLITAENLRSWSSDMTRNDVRVYLPKFEFSYEESLASTLQTLGMQDAFIPGKANFSSISDNPELYISKVKHKTYIKVDESGTEAAAATGIIFRETAAGPGIIFNADHPFIFAIREADTGTVLFIGTMANPAAERR